MSTNASSEHRRLARWRRPVSIGAALLLSVSLVAGVAVLIRNTVLRPTTVTAYFAKAASIYPGDTVQVAGVVVGHITAITAEGTRAKMTLSVDRNVPIPAGVKGVIVAQNLVAARYLELTPAYQPGDGPTMSSGGVIPLERTAVPVGWDQIKDQLMRLATDLGPRSDVSGTSVSRFIDSTANALAGNGDKLRQTLAELSQATRVLADGGGDIVDVISNLQTFVTALRGSNTEIVQFQDRFATLTSVLQESRSDLDAALTNLSTAITEVQRFIAGSRNQTSEQVQRLANVTQNLVDHRLDIENILHVAPNSIANAYNIYNPDSASVAGTFVMTPFANPLALVCGAIGSIENVTAPETAKLCAQYLGPALQTLGLNGLPFPINPYLAASASPDNIIYSDPALAPGGAGPRPGPAEIPPAVSAYQAVPSPPSSLQEMLLPRVDAPPSTPDSAGPPPGDQPLPAEASPPS